MKKIFLVSFLFSSVFLASVEDLTNSLQHSEEIVALKKENEELKDQLAGLYDAEVSKRLTYFKAMIGTLYTFEDGSNIDVDKCFNSDTGAWTFDGKKVIFNKSIKELLEDYKLDDMIEVMERISLS